MSTEWATAPRGLVAASNSQGSCVRQSALGASCVQGCWQTAAVRQGAAAAQGHASSRWDRGPGDTPEYDELTAACWRRRPCCVHACRRVQAAIAEAHQPGTGSVRQALCGALYEEVTDFYRLIAVLEGHLSAPMPTPGASGWALAGIMLTDGGSSRSLNTRPDAAC